MPSSSLLLYGATGYTGRLVASEAMRQGLRPILCGRSGSRIEALARGLGLEHRVAPLEQPARLDAVLRDVRVVLNLAGPFVRTASPLVSACLRAGSHYLDVTGEVPVVEAVRRRDVDARERDVMLMPAVGFDVVPSDCLAAHVAARLPGATHLYIGVGNLALLSRGSAKTFLQFAGKAIQVRCDGELRGVPAGTRERIFDYGDGGRPSSLVTWGDVASAYYTTGIPNIETYFETNPALRAALRLSRFFGPLLATPLWQTWLNAHADMRPEGPSDAQRAARFAVIVAEAAGGGGRRAVSRLRTPDAYTFTARCAVGVARRALDGDLEPGFQTPARVYGPDLVLAFPGVSREDVAG
jgi:short subunit dehydrogenase-like uncharacterized protein